jgi:DNA polymerase I
MELECLHPDCNKKYYSFDKGKTWFTDRKYKHQIEIKKSEDDEFYVCPNEYKIENPTPKNIQCNEPLLLHKNKKNIPEYTGYELMYYCFMDVDIMMELLTYDDYIVMKIIFSLMRLSNIGLQEFNESTITNWIKVLFHNEHRDRNWVIPEKDDVAEISHFETKSSTDKQFKGANVVDPKVGLHFDVTCMDYASLYPSIIKVRNLSYETVDNCDHEECKDNIVPSTNHVVCKRHKGIIAIIIGTIRDIRVLYFKSEMNRNYKLIDKLKREGKDDEIKEVQFANKLFEVMTPTFKVFINGAYGAMTYHNFPYKQDGMGESVTAYGRDAIELLIEYVENELGLRVIYGDTDSVFIEGIDKESIEKLIQWSIDVIKVPLGIDYDLRYMACSDRKKNYIGFYKQRKGKDGNRIPYDDPLWKKPLIKGMVGKKKNTPKFIRDKFSEIINNVDKHLFATDDEEQTKSIVKEQITYMENELMNFLYDVKNERIPVRYMSFIVTLGKDIEDYGTKDSIIKNKRLLKNARSGKMKFNDDSLLSQGKEQKDKIIHDIFDREVEAYKKFDTGGFHLENKAGLYLLQNGIKVGKDDRIEFIKTLKKYNGGALPTLILDDMDKKWEKIDKNDYYNAIKGVFEQLYDCFAIDTEPMFNKILGKKTVTTLDEMFGTPKPNPKTRKKRKR